MVYRKRSDEWLVRLFSPTLLLSAQYIVIAYAISISFSQLSNPERVLLCYGVPPLILLTLLPLFHYTERASRPPRVTRTILDSSAAGMWAAASAAAVASWTFVGWGILSMGHGGPIAFATALLADPLTAIEIQWNQGDLSTPIRTAILLRVLAPIVASIIGYRIGRGADSAPRRRLLVAAIAILLLSQLVLAWTLSARLLAVLPASAFLITLLFSVPRLSQKARRHVVVAGCLLIAFVLVAQIFNKPIDAGDGGLTKLEDYSLGSVESGIRLVDTYDAAVSPGYWTVRTALQMPVIGKFFQSLYETHVDTIPIKTREDDFRYAYDLIGPDAAITFGHIGYSYADWGMVSIVGTSSLLVVARLVYGRAKAGSTFSMLTFVPLLWQILEYNRTSIIFYDYSVYFLASIAALWFYDFATRNIRKHDIRAKSLAPVLR